MEEQFGTFNLSVDLIDGGDGDDAVVEDRQRNLRRELEDADVIEDAHSEDGTVEKGAKGIVPETQLAVTAAVAAIPAFLSVAQLWLARQREVKAIRISRGGYTLEIPPDLMDSPEELTRIQTLLERISTAPAMAPGMDGATLTGDQFTKLMDALIDAYQHDGYAEMLRRHVGKRLDLLTAMQVPFNTQVKNSMLIAEREGWTDALIQGAMADRPANAKLAAFYASYSA